MTENLEEKKFYGMFNVYAVSTPCETLQLTKKYTYGDSRLNLINLV